MREITAKNDSELHLDQIMAGLEMDGSVPARMLELLLLNRCLTDNEVLRILKAFIKNKIWEIPPLLIKDILSRDRRNIEIFTDMAQQLMKIYEYEAALNILKVCTSVVDGDPAAISLAAEISYNCNDYTECERYIRQAERHGFCTGYLNGLKDLLNLRNYLLGFFREDSYGIAYIDMHFKRFVETIKVLDSYMKGGTVLELGAYVYLSVLYRKFFDIDLKLNCFFGGEDPLQSITIENAEYGEIYNFQFHNFNVENDRFPFEDGTFDSVLAFELIEHIEDDPMFMLSEVNRVLKHGGRIILSTPNVASLRSLHFVLNGVAPYYYPKFGVPIGSSRHLREFTPNELVVMFESAGFEIIHLSTRDVWRVTTERFDYARLYERYQELIRKYDARHYPFATQFDNALRGEDIFIIGEKKGEICDRYPDMLYEHCGED